MTKKIAVLIVVVAMVASYIFLLVVLPKMAENVECDGEVTENITSITGNVSAFNIEPVSQPETIELMPKVYLILPGLIGGFMMVMIWLSPCKELADHPDNENE